MCLSKTLWSRVVPLVLSVDVISQSVSNIVSSCSVFFADLVSCLLLLLLKRSEEQSSSLVKSIEIAASAKAYGLYVGNPANFPGSACRSEVKILATPLIQIIQLYCLKNYHRQHLDIAFVHCMLLKGECLFLLNVLGGY